MRLLFPLRAAAALPLSAILLLSCSDDDSDAGGAADTGLEQSFDAEDEASDGGGGGAGDGGVGAGGEVSVQTGEVVADVETPEVVPVAVDRRIVYDGRIESVTADIDGAVREVVQIAANEGGFIFGQDADLGDDGAVATVTVKVPSVRFDAAFDAVAGIGDVQTRSVTAEDVTDRFVDLESRRATLEASIARLRGFLDTAANVEEVSRLESELTAREAERDVIAGQLRVLEDRTALAVITAVFASPDSGVEFVGTDSSEAPGGFFDGFRIGWDVAAAVATDLRDPRRVRAAVPARAHPGRWCGAVVPSPPAGSDRPPADAPRPAAGST